MPKSPNDKLQGTLTLLVLMTLNTRGPLHGYGLCEHIRSASDELLPALHEEIARLPEKYRLAVVHCDLEGMTKAQAAGQLH